MQELDKKRIINYVNTYGFEGEFNLPQFLIPWYRNKMELFKLLGNHLIYEIPMVKVEKDDEIIMQQIIQFAKANEFIREYKRSINQMTEYSLEDKNLLSELCNNFNMVNKTIYSSVKITKGKKTLQLQPGMKFIKAIQKVINFFNFTNCQKLYKEFENNYSLIHSDKIVSGTLCLSIHPLDFITASHNNYGWSSCVSWAKFSSSDKAGLLEMMNSPFVICAYLKGDKPFYFGKEKIEEWNWNNKKWRCFINVTPDILVAGKAYPFRSRYLSNLALEKLKDLAWQNLRWNFPEKTEEYNDMKTLKPSEILTKECFNTINGNNNIIFKTQAMYNDILNDKEVPYWSFRNKTKENKFIDISGECNCLKCGKPFLINSFDNYQESNKSYFESDVENYTYENTANLLCDDCIDDRYCEFCENEDGFYESYVIDDCCVCSKCWRERVRICPDCGKPYVIDQNFIAIKVDDDFTEEDLEKLIDEEMVLNYKDKNYMRLYPYYCCEDCQKKLIEDGVFQYVELSDELIVVSKDNYDKDSKIVQQHLYKNLEECLIKEDS